MNTMILRLSCREVLLAEPFGWMQCMSTWSFSAAVVSYQLSCQGGAKALQRWKVDSRPANRVLTWIYLLYDVICFILWRSRMALWTAVTKDLPYSSMKITSLEKLPERSLKRLLLYFSTLKSFRITLAGELSRRLLLVGYTSSTLKWHLLCRCLFCELALPYRWLWKLSLEMSLYATSAKKDYETWWYVHVFVERYVCHW